VAERAAPDFLARVGGELKVTEPPRSAQNLNEGMQRKFRAKDSRTRLGGGCAIRCGGICTFRI